MAWDDTQEGADVKNAWWQIRLLWNQYMPGHHQALHDLASRAFRR